MLTKKYAKYAIVLISVIMLSQIYCASKRSVRHTLVPIPRGSGIAVVIDSPNNIKNIVFSQFMKKGYRVKAVNASDLYTLHDVYDIRDFKKIAYYSGSDTNLISMEKSFNNIFKLHIYNYELDKASTLDGIRDRFNAQYLILLDLKDWESVSWGRAIDLRTREVVWLENYPTKYNDTVESIVDHFINSMSRR